MNFYPSFQDAVQTDHAAVAAVVVLAWAVWGGRVRHGVLAALTFAALKEFVFDIYVEGDGYLDGVLDFSFYVLGTAVAGGFVTWCNRRAPLKGRRG